MYEGVLENRSAVDQAEVEENVNNAVAGKGGFLVPGRLGQRPLCTGALSGGKLRLAFLLLVLEASTRINPSHLLLSDCEL